MIAALLLTRFRRQRSDRRLVPIDRLAQDLSAQNEIAHPFNYKPAQEIELIEQARRTPASAAFRARPPSGAANLAIRLAPWRGGFSGLAANSTTSRTAASWRQPSASGRGKALPQTCTGSNPLGERRIARPVADLLGGGRGNAEENHPQSRRFQEAPDALLRRHSSFPRPLLLVDRAKAAGQAQPAAASCPLAASPTRAHRRPGRAGAVDGFGFTRAGLLKRPHGERGGATPSERESRIAPQARVFTACLGGSRAASHRTVCRCRIEVLRSSSLDGARTSKVWSRAQK